MPLTAQQKVMLEHMGKQQGYRPYKEMAKETQIPAPSFRTQLDRLKEQGLVEGQAPDHVNWVITQEGIDLIGAGGTAISREDVGLTDFQYFEKLGRDIGGMTPEKLRVITNIVWSDDPNNLEWVWEALTQGQVPVDIKRVWFNAWRAYLKRLGRPTQVPEAIKAEVTLPEKRTEEQRKKMAEEGRDYKLVDGEPVRIGDGMGDYTLKDALSVLTVLKLGDRQARTVATQADHVPQETLSQLLTALQPYIKKDTDETLLKWILETQIKGMTKEIVDNMPKSQQQIAVGDQIGAFVKALDGLKSLGPVLRVLLGVPEQAPAAQTTQTPIQLLTPDGKPMVFDLNTYISLKKFEAEQQRETEGAKHKEEFMSSIRGFIERIGKAAERAAQP